MLNSMGLEFQVSVYKNEALDSGQFVMAVDLIDCESPPAMHNVHWEQI